MAYNRNDTGRWAWVKSVGSADDPLKEDWLDERNHLLDVVWFPKHPRSLREGDLLVYYAAGQGVFPAVVELTSDEVLEDRNASRNGDRWPWRMTVKPRLVIPKLSESPRLDDMSLDSLRLRRQSHIRLEPEEWDEFRLAFLPLSE